MIAWPKITKVTRYIQGVLGLGREDWILSSYPRSGNTWIRFLLCNLISLREWNGMDVDFPILNQTMIAFGVSDLLEPWTCSTIPRVVKTHRRYWPIFEKARGAIGIIRDPKDVMVSYYHFKKDRNYTYQGAFAEFIRQRAFGLESWFKHYTSWRDHWTCVVRYEDLRKDAIREFDRVLETMGVHCQRDIVLEAIQRSDIRNVQQVDRKKAGSDASFARDGRSRQWVDYFSDEDLSYYDKLVQQYQVSVYALKGDA